MTMRVSTQTMDAPGMVGCAIFKNADASDEIDLELVRSTFQIPLWKAGKRVGKCRGCLGRGLSWYPCSSRERCFGHSDGYEMQGGRSSFHNDQTIRLGLHRFGSEAV